jgi:hypothetical protein
MIEYKMSENPSIAKRYGVRVVPTVVIDAEVKIEGKPDIPFLCDAETYDHFRNKYRLIDSPRSFRDSSARSAWTELVSIVSIWHRGPPAADMTAAVYS